MGIFRVVRETEILAKSKSPRTSLSKKKSIAIAIPSLPGDIRQVIEAAREQTDRAVNSALVTMYWPIGKRIREDVLQNERAEYGKEIVSALSAQLTEEYGRGFGQRSLEQMIRFAEIFPDSSIAQTQSAQLSWSHFTEIIRLDDQLKRDFYAEMCRVERWSVRTLRNKIRHLLFERTAVAKMFDELIADDIAALRRSIAHSDEHHKLIYNKRHHQSTHKPFTTLQSEQHDTLIKL